MVERLDRALAAATWIWLFPKARVVCLEASCSNHLPILLEPIPLVPNSIFKQFRFENMWLREPDCEEIIKASWNDIGGCLIQDKIFACGNELMCWGDHLTRDFKGRISNCNKRMSLLRGRRDQASLEEFTEVRNKYNELLHSHEVF